jgi:excisionase family DNA binding protein
MQTKVSFRVMVNQRDFITVREAANLLGYTYQHTRLLLRQGKLRGTKIGRDWVVLREDVAEYNVRKVSLPLLPSTSKKGRPSLGERELNAAQYRRPTR